MKEAQSASQGIDPFSGESSDLQAAAPDHGAQEATARVVPKEKETEKEWNPWPFDMEITQADRDQFYMWTKRQRQFLGEYVGARVGAWVRGCVGV